MTRDNQGPQRPLWIYLCFAIMILVSSWETNRLNAAVIEQEIPQESIRLRILANSDSPGDQWVKRRIVDEVTQQMSLWATETTGIESAREAVRKHLPEIEAIISNVLLQYGYTYGYHVELGIVSFPAKMYGNRYYPAGDYEALRIILGKGEGQNWWCVLFPPLCFIDIVTGEAVASSDELNKQGEETTDGTYSQGTRLQEAKPKLLVWEVIRAVSRIVKGLFA